MTVRFFNQLVPELYQPFWTASQAGEFLTDAAAVAGAHRHGGLAWLRAVGGVRPRRGRTPQGRYLSFVEREEIALGQAAGESIQTIAARLGRSPSTISRELTCNADRAVRYRSSSAHVLAYGRVRRPKPAKLLTNQMLRERVWVSTETICQSLYVQSRGVLRRDLTRCLRMGRAMRVPNRQGARRRNWVLPDTIIAVPWAAGFALRLRQEEAGRRAASAVTEERRRVAREVHDVVGHALGVIVVQAGAERATLPPEAARSTKETLGAIEETARAALVEMRHLVDAMSRYDDGPEARSPQAGLAEVAALVRNVVLAGLPTELRVVGDPVPRTARSLSRIGPRRLRSTWSTTGRALCDQQPRAVVSPGSGSAPRCMAAVWRPVAGPRVATRYLSGCR